MTSVSDLTTATTRAVLDNQVELQSQTTTMIQAEPPQPIESTKDPIQLVGSRKEGLEDVLTREYQIDDIAWAYSSVGNTNIATLNFPAALIAITPLYERLKRFCYFRADLRLRLRCNSTPYHYGSLLVSYQQNNPTDALWARSIWQQSGSPSIVLSANNQTPVDIVIPYFCPAEALAVSAGLGDDLAAVKFNVLNPLKIAGSGSNPTISISCFAKFENIVLFGASAVANSSKATTTSKTETKRKQGFIGKTAGVVGDIAGALTKIPVVGGIAAAVSPIAKAVGSVADWFGWDKPPLLKPTKPISIFPSSDFPQIRGVQDSCVLGPDHDYRLSTEDRVYGVETPEARSFKALLQRPMLNDTFSITSAQATSTVFKTIKVKPFWVGWNGVNEYYPDYLGHYSSFFDSWRGGLKYLVYVSTSSYTSAKVRVTYQPNSAAVASVPNGGEANSFIIEIQGDTVFSFTVPYTAARAYTATERALAGSGQGIGSLHFSLVSATRTSGSTDTIYFNVFRSAAEDFEFNTPTTYVTPNCDYQSEFKKTFKPIIPSIDAVVQAGICKPDPFHHTTDYAKNASAETTTILDSQAVTISCLTGSNLKFFSPFRYWRGALNVYVRPFDNTMNVEARTPSVSNTFYDSRNGDNTNQTHAYTLPFECDERFRSFETPSYPRDRYLNVYNATGESHTLTVGAGDDFTVSGIKGPAYFTTV